MNQTATANPIGVIGWQSDGGGVKTNVVLHHKNGDRTPLQDPTVFNNQSGCMLLRKNINHDGAVFWLDQRGGGDDLVATGMGDDNAAHYYEECCW